MKWRLFRFFVISCLFPNLSTNGVFPCIRAMCDFIFANIATRGMNHWTHWRFDPRLRVEILCRSFYRNNRVEENTFFSLPERLSVSPRLCGRYWYRIISRQSAFQASKKWTVPHEANSFVHLQNERVPVQTHCSSLRRLCPDLYVILFETHVFIMCRYHCSHN